MRQNGGKGSPIPPGGSMEENPDFCILTQGNQGLPARRTRLYKESMQNADTDANYRW